MLAGKSCSSLMRNVRQSNQMGLVADSCKVQEIIIVGSCKQTEKGDSHSLSDVKISSFTVCCFFYCF